MKECTVCHRCYSDDLNRCSIDHAPLTSSIAGTPLLDNRYKLEQRLGQGGMGVVFKARHVFLKTEHAVKVILPDLVGNDPMLATRFRQEAMAAAAIRHQNIVAVTDFGVVNGIMPFLVMEFVQGRSLHDIIAKEGRLPLIWALEIMEAVAAGVGAAHQRGIVHRDLKPLNIMLRDGVPISEGVKVLDFGLAKIKSSDLLGSFIGAKTEGIMGSPFYMAPEQWSDEEPDSRADIYSLGIIFYQMLAGEVPFKGASLPVIMKKHLTGNPPLLASLGAAVAPQVEAVINHALQKNPYERPESIAAFINELRNAIASANIMSPTQPAVTVDPRADTIIDGPIAGAEQPANATPNVLNDLMHQAVADMQRLGEVGDPQSTPKKKSRARTKSRKALPAQEEIVGRTEQESENVAGKAQQHTEEEESTGEEAAAHAVAKERRRKEKQERQQREAEGRAHAPLKRELPLAQEPLEPLPQAAAARYTPLVSELVATYQLPADAAAQVPINSAPTPDALQQSDWQLSLSSFYNSASSFVAAQKKPFLLLGGGVMVVVIFLIGIASASLYVWFKGPSDTATTSSPKPTVKAEKMAAIPGGIFQMGRSDVSEGKYNQFPAHPVTVEAFFMDKTEVTNAEYAEFIRDTKYPPPSHWTQGQPSAGQEQWPVTNVSFHDAQAFAAWRSKRDGVQYRLPSEEEWEYAARDGAAGFLYPWGGQWREGTANVGTESPQPVGSLPQGASASGGVLDLIGNVWEWTASKASVYRGNEATSIPPKESDWLIIRGGSYANKARGEQAVTAAERRWIQATTIKEYLGFRLVKTR